MITDVGRLRLLDEALIGVYSMRKDIYYLALEIKTYAEKQTFPVADINSRIYKVLQNIEISYRTPLRNFRDNVVGSDMRFIELGDKQGITLLDTNTIATTATDALDAFALASKANYSEIVSACNTLLEAVPNETRIL